MLRGGGGWTRVKGGEGITRRVYSPLRGEGGNYKLTADLRARLTNNTTDVPNKSLSQLY